MMNRVTASGLRLRTTLQSKTAHALRPALIPRHHQLRGYATHHETRRRAVTPFNDDGHVPWTELSAGEKTARAAQQTFNFGMVILGVALTVCRPIQVPHTGPLFLTKVTGVR